MKRFVPFMLLGAFLLLFISEGLCFSAFDERLWEKYAGIEMRSIKDGTGLAGIYLEPFQLSDVTARPPFADLRVVTDRKEEVPWQIISMRPETRREELQVQMRNLSRTEKGETWLVLVLDRQDAAVNAVEVMTHDTDFSRQVQVFGSTDGSKWNTLRADGVIFDINRGEKLHYTRITFPLASFRNLALKITNGDAQPLTIDSVKVWQESDTEGQTFSVPGTIEKTENNATRQQSSIIVRMNTVFPLDRLRIATSERNFQRSVEVQIGQGNGQWVRWAQGTIFNFDTPTMRESQLTIDMPEVAAREFRLIFKNLDSPPLSITNVTGEGYRRLLVFKQQADRKLYLFWGNPMAQQPRYDLAALIAKQRPNELPIAYLAQPHPNSKFAGNNARLPFTERYKYLLYVVVTLAIAGLIFLQYNVFKRADQ